MSKDNINNSGINYIKYYGIAIQMVVIVFTFTYSGNWIDKYLELKIPVFTLILSFVSVLLSIYQLIRTIK